MLNYMWLKKRRQLIMVKNQSNRSNMSAQNRPFSEKATKKTQKLNLQTTIVDGKKVRLSTKEIRTIKKNK